MKASAFYKKFTNQGPAYFGDLDEKDGSLLEYETQLEEEGTSEPTSLNSPSYSKDQSGIMRIRNCELHLAYQLTNQYQSYLNAKHKHFQ